MPADARSTDEPGPRAPAPGPPRQSDRVTDELRSAILRLDLLPGSLLTERGLEQSFAASRTPARAALGRLEVEGLVERQGRGWRVTPIDPVDLAAVSEFRLIVEAAVVRLVVERATDEDLRRLADAQDPPAATGTAADRGSAGAAEIGAEVIGAGEEFHLRLAGLSGNAYLVDAVRGTLTRLARSRWLVVRDRAIRDGARAAHADLLAPLAARDADRAVGIVERHLRETTETVLAMLRDDASRHRLAGSDVLAR